MKPLNPRHLDNAYTFFVSVLAAVLMLFVVFAVGIALYETFPWSVYVIGGAVLAFCIAYKVSEWRWP